MLVYYTDILVTLISSRAYLKSHGVVTVSVSIFHFLFFAFLESAEIVLDEESRVKLADRHLIVHWKNRVEA